MAEESNFKKSSNDNSEGFRRPNKKSFERQNKHPKERGKQFKKKAATGRNERQEIERLNHLYETFDFENWQSFHDAPLSVKTKAGLNKCGFSMPTRIQKETLALALTGRDVLGAAKTGSGKTLAFIIPVLELLFREMWTRLDGLGALIITPTRELAYQIFEVLKKVGARHDFSAGLIIGGTEVGFERKRLQGCNIMICTPGRLLQHMDQNPLLDPTSLKILVLDEADRMLDMGFEKEMNAILENVPVGRQTLLFSATQTKSVKDLARLSLNNPCYVSVHEEALQATPDQLDQDYLVCELQDKMSLLWSFLKNHKSKKVIVFMSCCKQVQFFNTVIRRMKPGTTVMHLHGNMSQPRRMEIYDSFCSKQSAILLATDIAARGLDFPKVDWVFQLDCPEDSDTYIHRAGRTARFENKGNALLVLLPTEEEAMVKELKERKIPINKISVNPRRFYDIQRKVEAMCARDPELKASAQRCFNGYLKYVFVQKNKKVFQVEKLDLEMYARSLGLIVTPRARFLEKYFAAKGIKMPTMKAKQQRDEEEGEERRKEEASASKRTPVQLSRKIEKFAFDAEVDSDEEIFTKGKLLSENKEIGNDGTDSESEDDKNPEQESLQDEQKSVSQQKIITKVQAAKKVLKKKNIVPNKKVVFNDEGELEEDENVILAKPLEGVDEKGGINIELSKRLMREQDRIDKQLYREKIKAKHREERLKAKAERRAATLGGAAVLDYGKPDKESENEQGREEDDDDDDDDGRISGNESMESFQDEDVDEEERSSKDISGDESGAETDDSEEIPQRHVPKRPMKTSQKFGLKKRRVDDVEEIDTGLGLKGDEALGIETPSGIIMYLFKLK